MEVKEYFDEEIKDMHFVFKLAGLLIEGNKATYRDKMKSRLYYIFLFIWLNTDVIGEILWIIDGIINSKSFTEITSIVPCNALCMLCNLKALFHLYNEEKISNILDDFRNLDDGHTLPESEEKVEIVKKELQFFKSVKKCLRAFYISPAVTFSLTPMVLILLNYLNTKEVVLVLPFLVVYPFDPYRLEYWPFVYFHQSISAFIVITQIAATDTLLYTCCMYVNIYFKVLQHDLENLITNANKYRVDELNRKIEDCVRRHQKITRLVVLQEGIYSKLILFNFMSSSTVICLTGFNASAMDDIPFAITYVSFLLMALMQIFLLCYFGNMISMSSMAISSAVYNSQWYLTKPSIAKKLLFILKRGCRPSKLTAYGFIDVNLIAFTKVLSTSWSYFALLQSVYSRKP